MKRSPEMQTTVDSITKNLFGHTADEAAAKGQCVTCAKPLTPFRNEISRREYAISGMCQSCQDSVFGLD